MNSNAITFQILYPNGDPENMRVVYKRDWTGKVFYIGYEYFAECKAGFQAELEKPGVYLLIGREEEQSDDVQTIYIGQAENLLSRLDQHINDPGRNFHCIVCVTGAGYNIAHFGWMESHLISLAKEINRCTLENINMPTKPHLNKSEEGEINRFISDTLQFFPLVDVKAFIETKKVNVVTENAHVADETKSTSREEHAQSSQDFETKDRVINAFQIEKNIKLYRRSRATFYDETKNFMFVV